MDVGIGVVWVQVSLCLRPHGCIAVRLFFINSQMRCRLHMHSPSAKSMPS